MLQSSGNPKNRGVELAYGLLRVFLVALIAFPASAQERKNETGFLLGSEQIPGFTTTAGAPLSLGGSVAFSFDYARRLKGERTGLFVEVPFAAAPSHRVGSSQPGTATSLATLYVVPSIRLQAFANRRFSPWLSAGFGYGWLQTSASLNNRAPNPEVNRNTGTAQFGAASTSGRQFTLFSLSLCGQSCVTTTPSTRQITAHPFASRDSTI
jgi:hypothetical protein